VNLAPVPDPEAGGPPAHGAAGARGGPDGPGLSDDEASFLCGLFARVGLGLRHYKPETLARRLPACLRALRAANVAHARGILRRSPHLAWPAVGAVVIGVTSFFRDPPVFEALRRVALPVLLGHCRAAGRRLRVWSAGCSDGAELYSVAMLLDECGALSGGRCELIGTDCRPEAVARAASGAYDPPAVRGVPHRLLVRYFDYDHDGGRYRVSPALQDAVRWRVADVLDPASAPGGRFDLVLCRNLAIYLQPDATAALWGRLQSALRPLGVLALGKAERPVGVRGLRPLGAAPCLYYSREGVS
jgi:chemotaxis methyl-accepting protein methylase